MPKFSNAESRIETIDPGKPVWEFTLLLFALLKTMLGSDFQKRMGCREVRRGCKPELLLRYQSFR
jgi:hypothetical protein